MLHVCSQACQCPEQVLDRKDLGINDHRLGAYTHVDMPCRHKTSKVPRQQMRLMLKCGGRSDSAATLHLQQGISPPAFPSPQLQKPALPSWMRTVSG